MKSGEILSYDDLAYLEKKRVKRPYVIELSQDERGLLFYGSEHVNDPSHPQFHDIETRWNAFISLEANPIALVEGHFDQCPEEDTVDGNVSIIQGGEAQFLVHLARRDGVAVISPEPDTKWEANRLAERYTKEEIMLYYFLRQINYWNSYMLESTMRDQAVGVMAAISNNIGWKEDDWGVKRMEAIYQGHFGKPLEWENEAWTDQLTTPASDQFITNRISRSSGDLRDEHILKEIIQYWRQGKSPFAVFGSYHAIRLEPALAQLGRSVG